MLKRHPGLELPTTNEYNEAKKTISPDEPFVQILDPATGTATFLVESHRRHLPYARDQMEGAAPHRRATTSRMERLRSQAPSPAAPCIRTDDGPLRHRAYESRAQAI